MNMRRHWYVWLFLLSGITALHATIDFQEIGLAEARQQAEQQDKLFFLHFRASWCMPCQWMEENTFRDPELSAFVAQNYVAVKVDVDHAANKSLQARFGVDKLPSLLIFSTSGVLLYQVEEAIEAPALLRLLRKYDRPANHRIAWAATTSAEAMSSPKPQDAFSRPALLPDAEEAIPAASGHQQLIVGTTPAATPVPRQMPVSYAQPNQLAPRQVQRYGIQLSAQSTYREAWQEVMRLESQFSEVVEAYPREIAGETIYLIVIGNFAKKDDAHQLLYYLNRKDITGQIVNIAGE